MTGTTPTPTRPSARELIDLVLDESSWVSWDIAPDRSGIPRRTPPSWPPPRPGAASTSRPVGRRHAVAAAGPARRTTAVAVRRLRRHPAQRHRPSIVNDVAVTPDGDAYLTEFIRSQLYRIPAKDIRPHRTKLQPLPVFLDFRGTAFPVQEGSANGIVATPDGRHLIVAQSSRGELYRVRLHDKRVTRIDLQGGRLNVPDGMVLNNAGVLYVAEPPKGRVTEIRLSDHYTRGRIVSRTTSPLFRCPTAVDIAGDRLLVSNSQYCSDSVEMPFQLTSVPIP